MCCPCVTPDILFYITALAIMQDFQDDEKKWLKMAASHGPAILLFFIVNITKLLKTAI